MRGSSSLFTDHNGNNANNAPSTSHPPPPPPSPRHRGGNVYCLLARREVCPRTKCLRKNLWGETSANRRRNSFDSMSEAVTDARRSLISWVEAESLMHLSAKYCPLSPLPRSTIAATFSLDGNILASTHGDHTVKIMDSQTGSCLKVLSGHRRTPWVVRFHPFCPDILASGSLDHEVRLWNANTAECIGSRDFYRPIASIAFHAHGELLAVASGHKLFVWQYNKRGEASSPAIILKTRRSLRAVHFHPHAAPFLLTAEVNDLDSSESTMTLATSSGYLHYPSPTIYLANALSSGRPSLGDELPLISLPFLMWPSVAREAWRTSVQQSDEDADTNYEQQRMDPSTSLRLLTYSTPSGQYELLLSPIEPGNSSPVLEESQTDSYIGDVNDEAPRFLMDPAETMVVQHGERNNHIFPFGDQMHWQLPFLHGWLAGQGHAGHHRVGSINGSADENLRASGVLGNHVSSSVIPITTGQSRGTGRSRLRYQSSQSQAIPTTGSGESAAFNNIARNENETHSVVGRIQPEVATSLAAAAAAAELPCTVKLRIWPHDINDPCAPLVPERCRLTIPHAVLCSEMGAHFSPCGRLLAACVACVLPHWETDLGLQGQVHQNTTGGATSPTQHPISAPIKLSMRYGYIHSRRFGSVLVSRAIRAAHCLTSIQAVLRLVPTASCESKATALSWLVLLTTLFSPTSEHLLLAYGRRHSSLLKSVVIDGERTVPVYTVLEVYRVSDMELVRVLPSAEDEVNVACFHPLAGGGLVYGTKEGKLRILHHDSSYVMNHTMPCLLDKHMLEVPTYALEC